jgi:RNA:NAD 2'-phosphotransferase (TPT1/KptA family)
MPYDGNNSGNFPKKKPYNPNFSRPFNGNTLARSLFQKYEEYSEAERLLIGVLEGKVGKVKLKKDSNGAANYCDVLDIMEQENLYLSYLGYEHVVEIFLRHTPVMFKLDGDFLVSAKAKDAGKDIMPPELLFFGTVAGVANKAVNKGLISKRHPYIILQSDRIVATKTAEAFSQESGDDPVVIEIRAMEACKSGTPFLLGNREGQYMTEYVSRNYLNFPKGFAEGIPAQTH